MSSSLLAVRHAFHAKTETMGSFIFFLSQANLPFFLFFFDQIILQLIMAGTNTM
jgi:hypothetical protein